MSILVSSVNKQDAFNFTSDGNVDNIYFESSGLRIVSLELNIAWTGSHIVDGAFEVTGSCRDQVGAYGSFSDFDIGGNDLVKSGNLIQFPATSSAEFRSIVTFREPPKWLNLRMQYTTFTSGTVQGSFSWGRL